MPNGSLKAKFDVKMFGHSIHNMLKDTHMNRLLYEHLKSDQIIVDIIKIKKEKELFAKLTLTFL